MSTLTYFADGEYEVFRGRILGVIDKKEYCTIKTEPKSLADKLYTSGTVDINDLVESVGDNLNEISNAAGVKIFDGVRIVFCTKVDNEKKIVISGEITDMYNVEEMDDSIKEVSFVDTKNDWFTLEI